MYSKIKISSKILAPILILFVVSCSPGPKACFTIDKGKTAKLNEEVQFSATCSESAVTFNWNFGDGTSGTEITTKHKYTTAGTYAVKLTVTTGSKSGTLSQDLVIAP